MSEHLGLDLRKAGHTWLVKLVLCITISLALPQKQAIDALPHQVSRASSDELPG